MSSSPVSRSPSVSEEPNGYKHPESALKVDMSTPDKAAKSLESINKQFPGKKILFYKHGKNYFAVPEDNRPTFWRRQVMAKIFSCCFDAEQPEYANTEVGQKLANYFGKNGRDLQSKMKWGFWKQAVAAEEFFEPIEAIGEKLCAHADHLFKTLGQQWNNAIKESGQTPQAVPGSLKLLEQKARELRKSINDGSFALGRGDGNHALDEDDEGRALREIKELRAEIIDIQVEFWEKLARRLKKTDNSLDSLANSVDVQVHLEMQGVSRKSVSNIRDAGLITPKTTYVLEHWVEPPPAGPEALRRAQANRGRGGVSSYARLIEHKANALKEKKDSVQQTLTTLPRFVRSQKLNDYYLHSPFHVKAVQKEITELTGRFDKVKRLSSAMSIQDQAAEIDAIAKACEQLKEYASPGRRRNLDRTLLNQVTAKHFPALNLDRLKDIDQKVQQAEANPERAHFYLANENTRRAIGARSNQLAEELKSVDRSGRSDNEKNTRLRKIEERVEFLESLTVASQDQSRDLLVNKRLMAPHFEARKQQVAKRLNGFADALDGGQDDKRPAVDQGDKVRKEIEALGEKLKDLDVQNGDRDEIGERLKQLEAEVGKYQQYFPSDRTAKQGGTSAAATQ